MVVPGLESGSIYLRILWFLGIFVGGILFTRLILMPGARRLMYKGSKKAAHSTENIIGLVGFFLTLALALQAGGFGNMLTVVGTIAAAATVGIGFGMRDQIASVIAGFFIYTDNPYLKGDYIEANDIEGRVQEIHLRTTVLKGIESEKQIVPNNILTTNNLRNYSRSNRTKLSTEFKVDADKADEASEILKEVAEESSEAYAKPEPENYTTSLEEGKANLVLNIWVKESADIKSIKSSIYNDFIQKASSKDFFSSKDD